MGWTVTPDDGGASVDSSGRASFSPNTTSSSKIYTVIYSDGSTTCSKDIKIEPDVPPTPCTYTVYSNIIGANVTWSNGAIGTISSQGFSTTTATSEGAMTVTLDHKNGGTACTFVGNEAEVPCNGNIYISGSCDPISPPDPPEDYCQYVACDSHSIYADGNAHGRTYAEDRKCDSLYIYNKNVGVHYYTTGGTEIGKPDWITVKITHQGDPDWGEGTGYTCSNYSGGSESTAYRLQDKLGLEHNVLDTNLASVFYLLDANNTGGERSVVVRYSINGTVCQEATKITQGVGTCAGDMHNSTDATTKAIPATGGTNIQIGWFDHMTGCPTSWRAESFPEWVTNVSYTYDTATSGRVFADIAENKTNVLRQGRGGSSLGNIYEEIAIYQAGNNTICTCYASGIHDLTLPATTSNTEYEVGICSTSNCSSTSWQLPVYTSGYDFLQFTRVAGGKIYAKVKSKNSGSDIRSAVYTIKNGTSCSDTFSVKQAGSTPTACTCSNVNINITGAAISYKAGSGRTIGSFTANCNPNGLLSFISSPNALSNYKVVYYSDTKSGLIQADAVANTSTTQRNITVTANCGGTSKTFTVTQNGKPAASCDCASASFGATGKTVSPGSNVTAATYTASCTDGATVELESGVAILGGAIRLEGGNIVCDYVSASTVARTGTYKVSIGGTKCASFTVNCAATPSICKCTGVTVTRRNVIIQPSGGEADVAIIPAGCNVVLLSDLPDWIEVFKDSRNELIVSALENNTGATRGCGIPFALAGDSSAPCAVITVSQKSW